VTEPTRPRKKPSPKGPGKKKGVAKQRRPGGRNAEVREAVRRAPLELLTQAGFDAVTLPAVARRAGVNKTTVYRSWASPAELLEDALAELEALALPDLDTGSFESDVTAFVASRLALIREPHAAAILRAVIGAGEPHPALYAWVETFWKPRQREWRSPIERAIERGELAASAREVPLVELVAGPLLLAQLATRRRVTRPEVETIASIIVAGVKARHASKSAATKLSPGAPAGSPPGSRSSRASR
jgi:AcrR family transcriptional regulator